MTKSTKDNRAMMSDSPTTNVDQVGVARSNPYLRNRVNSVVPPAKKLDSRKKKNARTEIISLHGINCLNPKLTRAERLVLLIPFSRGARLQ